MEAPALRDAIVAEARRLGFSSAGVAAVRPLPLARRRALTAIAEGRMAGMAWMSPQRIEHATDLGRRHPWARSVVALAWPSPPAGDTPVAEPGHPRGRIAAYACLPEGAGGVADYHRRLARACDDLAGWLRGWVPEVRTKRFIDHGWAIDRALAEEAGIGFCGRNACLITREAGSYVLLAELLVSVDLPPTPRSRRGCGRCQACLPACPTGAITESGVIDSRRCISYLTIEHDGPIPLELRPLVGTWAFGCDLCQEVCPINRRRAPAALATGGASTARGPVPFPDLVELLELDEAEFGRRFSATAVARAGRARLARNAAVALGNAGDPAAVGPLRRAAAGDADADVREAAAWALGRLGARTRTGAHNDNSV